MTTDIDALVERLEMEWFFPNPSAAAKKVEAVLAQRKEAAQALTRLSEENARLREAGIALALAAGKLTVALDGQEQYRLHRQAILSAMEDFHSAIARAALQGDT